MIDVDVEQTLCALLLHNRSTLLQEERPPAGGIGGFHLGGVGSVGSGGGA